MTYHPLAHARLEAARVAHRVLVRAPPLQNVHDCVESAVRVHGGARKLARTVVLGAQLIQQQERVSLGVGDRASADGAASAKKVLV